MSRVVHFEIPADDPERAVEFYKKVFGWKIDKWEGPMDYWLVKTGEDDEMGINGAIMPKEFGDKVRNTIAVESLDEAIKKIEAQGGKMLTEKQTIPNIGVMAAFEDTEGNISVILKPDMIK